MNELSGVGRFGFRPDASLSASCCGVRFEAWLLPVQDARRWSAVAAAAVTAATSSSSSRRSSRLSSVGVMGKIAPISRVVSWGDRRFVRGSALVLCSFVGALLLPAWMHEGERSDEQAPLLLPVQWSRDSRNASFVRSVLASTLRGVRSVVGTCVLRVPFVCCCSPSADCEPRARPVLTTTVSDVETTETERPNVMVKQPQAVRGAESYVEFGRAELGTKECCMGGRRLSGARQMGNTKRVFPPARMHKTVASFPPYAGRRCALVRARLLAGIFVAGLIVDSWSWAALRIVYLESCLQWRFRPQSKRRACR